MTISGITADEQNTVLATLLHTGVADLGTSGCKVDDGCKRSRSSEAFGIWMALLSQKSTLPYSGLHVLCDKIHDFRYSFDARLFQF